MSAALISPSKSIATSPLASAGFGAILAPEHAPRLPSLAAIPIEGDPVRREVQLLAVAGRQYSPALDAFIKIARVRDWTNALDELRRASAHASNNDNARKADAQTAGSLI